jgi:capsid protein
MVMNAATAAMANRREYGIVQPVPPTPRHVSNELVPRQDYAMGSGYSPSEFSMFSGEKFPTGFGPTQLFALDYWTLRKRSEQLFRENLYARGLIRRLITNEVNTGLTPEAAPDASITGVDEDILNEWSETVETRFGIWSKNPQLCDWKGENTFGKLQQIARQEALVSGDVLVFLRRSQRTGLPTIQLIGGDKVRSPFDPKLRTGHEIKHGVEMDAVGKVVAYWIKQKSGEPKRLPAFGQKSGRRLAWLVFGTDKRLDDVRGEPLLSVVLQSLKEIDRYRDSVQRKAVVNSIMAMFIKKTQEKIGSLPMTGGALRNDTLSTTDSDGSVRDFNLSRQIPGLVIEELQVGEEPVLKGGEGTDINFATFEAAIISAVAWANEIPPEILTQAFSNNYSASAAAINEFKIYLNKFWSDFGEGMCQPIYIDWLVSESLSGKISAPGFIDAWRDPLKYDVFGAWVMVDWYGSIKPSTDVVKQAKGSKMMTDEGWSTNARESRTLSGTKFDTNIKRLKRENQLKADAARPLLELKKEFGESDATSAIESITDAIETSIESLEVVSND